MGSRWNSSPAAVTPAADTARQDVLCRRALARLRIAAALIHCRHKFGEVDDQASGRLVLGIIGRLGTGAQERLRGQVDWVEAYETKPCAPACRLT